MNTFCTAKTAFIEFWAWPNKAFWSSLTSCGENRNMWPFKRDVKQYFVLINFERFCCRTETTYKLVFFSDLPLLPLDDPLTATVVDSHYHSWSRVHQETSLPLLTSIQIVCPWQLLTVITKPVQHKNEVVINSLYKALPLSLIYWFWDALNHTKGRKCNNDGLTWLTLLNKWLEPIMKGELPMYTRDEKRLKQPMSFEFSSLALIPTKFYQ